MTAPSVKVALLLLGLLVGGTAGYLTRPEVAEIKLGDMSIGFQSNQVIAGTREPTTSAEGRHVLLYTLAGGMIGALAGFALDRRR